MFAVLWIANLEVGHHEQLKNIIQTHLPVLAEILIMVLLLYVYNGLTFRADVLPTFP